MARAPALEEIVTRNWTLEEFLEGNFFEGGEIVKGVPGTPVQGIRFFGNKPSILRAWARKISPKVEQLYTRLGWKAFQEDLLMVYHAEGRLFLTANKYSFWLRTDGDYLIVTATKEFSLVEASSFEDVFLNIIDLTGAELTIVEAASLDEAVVEALDPVYSRFADEVDSIVADLQEGPQRVIHILGYPLELSISPLVEMYDGYLLVNKNFEFVTLGHTLMPRSRGMRGDVYAYEDGHRLIASLLLNEGKWEVVSL